MDYFADIFLGAGALAAAFYCLVLSRKLSRLSGLDQDLGSAIAVLSKQVDEMTNVLNDAKHTAGQSAEQLQTMTARAEDVAGKLEIMLGALEELPDLSDSVEPQVSAPVLQSVESEHEGGSVFLRHSKRVAGAEV